MSSKAGDELNQERYTRMVAEEGLTDANTKMVSLEAELARVKGKNKTLEHVVEETKALNSDLKNRLDQMLQILQILVLQPTVVVLLLAVCIWLVQLLRLVGHI